MIGITDNIGAVAIDTIRQIAFESEASVAESAVRLEAATSTRGSNFSKSIDYLPIVRHVIAIWFQSCIRQNERRAKSRALRSTFL